MEDGHDGDHTEAAVGHVAWELEHGTVVVPIQSQRMVETSVLEVHLRAHRARRRTAQVQCLLL